MPPVPSLPAAARAQLAQRLAHVQQQILLAQTSAPANTAPVQLLAASKYQPLAALFDLYAMGVRDFAENYPQELAEKAQAFAAHGLQPRWHLIGGLQRNKAALVAAHADCVHSVDSIAVAQALARARDKLDLAGAPLAVLVQVAMPASEDGAQAAAPGPRRGCAPEDVPALLQAILAAPALRLSGFMGLPHKHGDAAAFFAALQAFAAAARRTPGTAHAAALSMGMSDDFSVAVRHGATMVRVGSALFGPRPQPHKERT